MMNQKWPCVILGENSLGWQLYCHPCVSASPRWQCNCHSNNDEPTTTLFSLPLFPLPSTIFRISACTSSIEPCGIDHDDLLRRSGGLGQETFAHPGVKRGALLLHAVQRPGHPCGGHLGGHVQHDRQVGHQAAGGHAAHLPKRGHVQPAAVALVDHVGQQVAIAHHGLALLQRRPDHFFDHLRPGGHVEEHLAAAVDVQIVPIQQDAADRLAQRRAARVAAAPRRRAPAGGATGRAIRPASICPCRRRRRRRRTSQSWLCGQWPNGLA